MAKWALIVDNSVREIVDSDPTGKYAPSLTWVSCSNSVKESDIYDSDTDTFTPKSLPGQPNLTDLATDVQENSPGYKAT